MSDIFFRVKKSVEYTLFFFFKLYLAAYLLKIIKGTLAAIIVYSLLAIRVSYKVLLCYFTNIAF